ncbi:hypothetical protein HDV05_003212 [Chytridiales sp. JEL 0842]|nr:hypothetical protein HDV05_003212 [Chytridiales sp. JEL 0842]
MGGVSKKARKARKPKTVQPKAGGDDVASAEVRPESQEAEGSDLRETVGTAPSKNRTKISKKNQDAIRVRQRNFPLEIIHKIFDYIYNDPASKSDFLNMLTAASQVSRTWRHASISHPIWRKLVTTYLNKVTLPKYCEKNVGGYYRLVRKKLWAVLCPYCLKKMYGQRRTSNVILNTHLADPEKSVKACRDCRCEMVERYPERAFEGVNFSYFIKKHVDQKTAMQRYNLSRYDLLSVPHTTSPIWHVHRYKEDDVFRRACEVHGGLEGMRLCGIYIPLILQ